MSALYTLFVYPLELFFEVAFTVAYRLVGNLGFAIIILSLAVNLLVLPLYKRADEVQREERDLEAALAPGISHIKKTFKGDERMMMLNIFYAQNNYSPLYVLKGSASLFLQIPFFMAAYRFLSNLKILRGVSFGLIHDLGAPDQMIVIAGIGINLLPILMTLTNFISGYIYTKGMPLKSKIQLYGVALIFLVLLYDSPSGLAFYWTLNNVFSLVKNLCYRFIGSKLNLTGKLAPAAGLLKIKHTESDKRVFFLSGIFMTMLIGLLIPSAAVKSSPTEFMDFMDLVSPNTYLINSMLVAAGYFIFWGGVFFFLAGDTAKAVMSRIWWAVCPASLVTYFAFGTKLGLLTPTLAYEIPFVYSIFEKLINTFIVAAIFILAIVLARKNTKVVTYFVFIFVAVCCFMSISNMVKIQKAYEVTAQRLDFQRPYFTLSTEGRNVMVIMLDRAPGYLVPYIFNEMPELADQFDGFTFYPNAISFGVRTKHATPALFGGYDYTPQLIVADTEKTLRQTQNEALTVMPLLFAGEGFDVTVCDPPFANYMSPPDISMFSGFEGINAYITEGNMGVSSLDLAEFSMEVFKRNIFCYSFMKVSPVLFQGAIYDNGNYNMADRGVTLAEDEFTTPQYGESMSTSTGVNQNTMNAYQVLYNLDTITDIVDDETDTFMYLINDLTHDTMLLQEPEYVPAQYVDNTEYDILNAGRFDQTVNGFTVYMDSWNHLRHYQCNMAAYIMLGDYFDYLREEGVYDNTRIIIVADHGTSTDNIDMFNGALRIPDTPAESSSIDAFNPVLMVKDFGSEGFNICDSVITNADVPYIALNGIIDDPINPYTGNPIIPLSEYDGAICVYDSYDSSVTETEAGGDALRFVYGNWYAFDGTNVYDRDSWVYVGLG